jgi:hypothetical protein
MKRLLSIGLCLMLVLSFAIPAMAAEPEIIFTTGSKFEVGGTVKVDEGETLLSTYNNGTSDIYNAYLEGDVQYYWMRDGVYYADGPSLKLKESDKGCEFYCVAALYSDADHTQQCGTIYSKKFTVPAATIPDITTKSIPNGKVGEYYYQKLECTDPDVTYSLFRSSLPDGLTLTQHGEIEGTPTKAGFWYVVVMATPEAGADYATTAEYEITIEEGQQYSLEIMEVPDKVVYTAGEKLDMTGLWVRIYTPDGFIDSRNGKYLTYSTKALTTVGEQKIKLTYEDAVEFFIVTVNEAPPEETEPTETEPAESEPTETDPTENVTEEDADPTEEETSKRSKRDRDRNAEDSGDSDSLMLVIVCILAFVSIAAVTALIVVLIKQKKK